MLHTCVAVVDATRARLFLYQRSAEPEGVVERFVERADFVNPTRRQRPSEIFSDSRPGSSRVGARQFAFDDHRAAHLDAFDLEFATAIGHEIAALVRESGAVRIVLCASTRMLDKVRRALGDLPRSVRVDTIPRDLVKLAPNKLRDQLASYTLLPTRAAR